MDPNRLRAIQLFSELSDEDLQRVATFATEDSVPEGRLLMREGDFSTEMVGIEEGSAEVQQGDRTVATLEAGDVFGEMGLVEKSKRSASVVSTSPMRIVKLTQWELRRLPEQTRERLQSMIQERRSSDQTR